jgi:Phage tail lysozyme
VRPAFIEEAGQSLEQDWNEPMTRNSPASLLTRRKVTGSFVVTGLAILIGANVALPPSSNDNDPSSSRACLRDAQISGPDLSTARAREEYAFHFWKDKGLSDVQASAVVGNFMGEGSRKGDILDPSILGGWEEEAFGIGQWLGERKEKLFEFAKNKGVDLFKSPLADRMRVENEFAHYEFQTTETRAWQQLIKAKTIDAATDAMARFERWRGWEQGKAGAEAGTHYLEAHRVYRAAKSGAFDRQAAASR